MKNTLIWLQEMEDNNESWVNISSVINMLKKEQEDAIEIQEQMNNDDKKALNYNKAMTFNEFKKELFREKDGVYQWKTETKNRWFTEEYVRCAYDI